MPGDILRCPQCGTKIEITEALAAQISTEMQKDYADKIEAAREEFDGKLEAMKTTAADTLEASLKKAREQASVDAKKDVGVELEDLQAQIQEHTENLEKAKKEELNLRKRTRKLERREQDLELEAQRKIDSERKKIKLEMGKQMDEEKRLKEAEMSQTISGLRKQIDDLKRKAEQGSQQLQGEAQEVVLEEDLRAAFPYDDIREVPKGIRGADCVQDVKSSTGILCGAILWESKRTKNWNKGWAAKLKGDQREAKADVAVIVSQVLPDGVSHVGLYEGVWVCDFASCLGLATVIRNGLVQIAQTRISNVGKDEKMEALYDYLTGAEFRQAVEGIVESFVGMKEELEAEKRAISRLWAKREKAIERTINNTGRMYGSLQGIAGITSFPEIERLALPEAETE